METKPRNKFNAESVFERTLAHCICYLMWIKLNVFLHCTLNSHTGSGGKIALNPGYILMALNYFYCLRFPKFIQAKFLFTLGYLVKVEVCMDVSHYPATPAILIACAGVRGQRAGFSFHTPYRTAGSVRVCTRAALRIQPWQAWCNWLREVNP